MRKSEETSDVIVQRLKHIFLKDRTIIVTYCGNTEGLANYSNSVLRIAKPDINVALFDGDYAYNIVIPYIAEDISSVVLFSNTLSVRCMYRVLQALLSMGIEVLAISPTATLIPRIKEYLTESDRRLNFIEIDSSIYRLSLLQALLRLALEISGRTKTRIKRIEYELDLKSVVKDLTNRYLNQITKSKNIGLVAITKSLLVAGEELMDKEMPVLILGKHKPEVKPSTLLVYTSVEEHLVNEYLTELKKKSLRDTEITTIRLNVDPFTAPIYALIIFYAMLL